MQTLKCLVAVLQVKVAPFEIRRTLPLFPAELKSYLDFFDTYILQLNPKAHGVFTIPLIWWTRDSPFERHPQ